MQQSEEQDSQELARLRMAEPTHLNRHCVDYFEKYVCTQFAPHRQFLQLHHCAEVVPSTPQFQPTISKSLRDNLKVERQIQYLKASLRQQHIYSTIQEQLKCQQHYQPLKRRGSMLLQHEGTVYWAYQSKLMSMPLAEVVKHKIQENQEPKRDGRQTFEVWTHTGKQLIDIAEQILEIKRVENLLILRTARKLFLFSLQTSSIAHCYTFTHQITTAWNAFSSRIFVAQTDGAQSIIEMIDLQSNQSIQSNFSARFLHSGWNIHSHSSVVCSYETVHSLDLRINKSQTLRTCQRNCRIFGGVSLGGRSFSENYFITSESFKCKIFDMRNTNKVLGQITHFCEESPPTILQLYEPESQISAIGSKSNKQLILSQMRSSKKLNSAVKATNPIIVATNPYPFGSSLYAQLSQTKDYQNISKSNKSQGFGLLFDKGKLDKGYHPLSATLVRIGQHLAFLHLDNFGGLSLQMFTHETLQLKSKKQPQRKLRRVEFNKERGLEQVQNPNQSWLIKRRLDIYLEQEEKQSWGESIDQDSMDLQLADNAYKEKYLRYADLKAFYSKLALSKSQINVEELEKAEETQVRKVLTQTGNRVENVFQTLASTFADSRQAPQKTMLSQSLLEELSKAWDDG